MPTSEAQHAIIAAMGYIGGGSILNADQMRVELLAGLEAVKRTEAELEECRVLAEQEKLRANTYGAEILEMNRAAGFCCRHCGDELKAGTWNEHLKTCLKHPMREVERVRDDALQVAEKMRVEIEGVHKWLDESLSSISRDRLAGSLRARIWSLVLNHSSQRVQAKESEFLEHQKKKDILEAEIDDAHAKLDSLLGTISYGRGYGRLRLRLGGLAKRIADGIERAWKEGFDEATEANMPPRIKESRESFWQTSDARKRIEAGK